MGIESPDNYPIQIIKGKYCLIKTIFPIPPKHSYKINETIVPEQILKHISLLGFSNAYQFDKAITNMVDVGNILNNGKLLNIGMCIPSTCSSQDIQSIINYCKLYNSY